MADLEFIKEGLDLALETKAVIRKVLLEGIGPAYQVGRDGQLFPTAGMTPAQAFYNFAMLPGWQKWKPIYRHGVLNSIDQEANTGNVSLESATSSAQNLYILRVANLSAVEFDYMNCNHGAFEEGDAVLVKFMPKGSILNKLSALDAAKADLRQVRKELVDLKMSRSLIDIVYTSLLNELGSLHAEYQQLVEEYNALLDEDPQDLDAIEAKTAEIDANQAAIDEVEADIAAQQKTVDAKEADIAAKEAEIETKKDSIDSQINTIVASVEDFAEPTIIGFKEDPKPCNYIYPYLKVGPPDFPAYGYLVCDTEKFIKYDASDMGNSIEFDGEFKLIAWENGEHPQRFEEIDGVLTETSGLAVHRYDVTGLYWDDLKYMDATGFDNTWAETYTEWYNGSPKPYYVYWESEVVIDEWNDQILKISGGIHDHMSYHHYLFFQRDTNFRKNYNYIFAGKTIVSGFTHETKHIAKSYTISAPTAEDPSWLWYEEDGHNKLTILGENWFDWKDAWTLAASDQWHPPIPPPAKRRCDIEEFKGESVYFRGECYSQEDTSKYAFVIVKVQNETYSENAPCNPICHDLSTRWLLVEAYVNEIGRESYFEGLGFKKDVPEGNYAMRLYNFEGKYICLFMTKASNGEYYMGSAIEGGSFSIRRVNKFLVDEVSYTLTGTGSFGFVEQNKPTGKE